MTNTTEKGTEFKSVLFYICIILTSVNWTSNPWWLHIVSRWCKRIIWHITY